MISTCDRSGDMLGEGLSWASSLILEHTEHQRDIWMRMQSHGLTVSIGVVHQWRYWAHAKAYLGDWAHRVVWVCIYSWSSFTEDLRCWGPAWVYVRVLSQSSHPAPASHALLTSLESDLTTSSYTPAIFIWKTPTPLSGLFSNLHMIMMYSTLCNILASQELKLSGFEEFCHM